MGHQLKVSRPISFQKCEREVGSLGIAQNLAIDSIGKVPNGKDTFSPPKWVYLKGWSPPKYLKVHKVKEVRDMKYKCERECTKYVWEQVVMLYASPTYSKHFDKFLKHSQV
jgi:hypothetical protein